MEEKNYDRDIAELKGQIAQNTEAIRIHDKRIEKHGEEIDAIAKQDKENAVEMAIVKESLKRIEQNTESIKESVKKSDVKWEQLKKQRDEDHLVQPKGQFDKYKEKVVMILIGVIVTFFITFLFPDLIK